MHRTHVHAQVADAIIHHSSVRSMLLTQKAIAEGGRSMLYECAQIADRMLLCEANGDEKGAQVNSRPPRVLMTVLLLRIAP